MEAPEHERVDDLRADDYAGGHRRRFLEVRTGGRAGRSGGLTPKSLGLETTAEVGFGDSSLSATVSANYEHSVETVLSQSQTVSCTSKCNDTNGAVYA